MQAASVLGVEPDWILCGNGSDDILTIVTRALVGEGDLLRLPYPVTFCIARSRNCRAVNGKRFTFDPTLHSTTTLQPAILD